MKLLSMRGDALPSVSQSCASIPDDLHGIVLVHRGLSADQPHLGISQMNPRTFLLIAVACIITLSRVLDISITKRGQ